MDKATANKKRGRPTPDKCTPNKTRTQRDRFRGTWDADVHSSFSPMQCLYDFLCILGFIPKESCKQLLKQHQQQKYNRQQAQAEVRRLQLDNQKVSKRLQMAAAPVPAPEAATNLFVEAKSGKMGMDGDVPFSYVYPNATSFYVRLAFNKSEVAQHTEDTTNEKASMFRNNGIFEFCTEALCVCIFALNSILPKLIDNKNSKGFDSQENKDQMGCFRERMLGFSYDSPVGELGFIKPNLHNEGSADQVKGTWGPLTVELKDAEGDIFNEIFLASAIHYVLLLLGVGLRAKEEESSPDHHPTIQLEAAVSFVNDVLGYRQDWVKAQNAPMKKKGQKLSTPIPAVYENRYDSARILDVVEKFDKDLQYVQDTETITITGLPVTMRFDELDSSGSDIPKEMQFARSFEQVWEDLLGEMTIRSASSPADPNAGASTASVANVAMPKENWEEAKAWAGHEAFAEDVEERLAFADPDAAAAADPDAAAADDTGQSDGTGLHEAFSVARGGIGKVSLQPANLPKPYAAQMRRCGKNVTLGHFATAEEAALCVARTPEGQAAAKRAAATPPLTSGEALTLTLTLTSSRRRHHPKSHRSLGTSPSSYCPCDHRSCSHLSTVYSVPYYSPSTSRCPTPVRIPRGRRCARTIASSSPGCVLTPMRRGSTISCRSMSVGGQC